MNAITIFNISNYISYKDKLQQLFDLYKQDIYMLYLTERHIIP